ncbi:unnamed protein product, partial [Closterium sp. Yama58-4]
MRRPYHPFLARHPPTHCARVSTRCVRTPQRGSPRVTPSRSRRLPAAGGGVAAPAVTGRHRTRGGDGGRGGVGGGSGGGEGAGERGDGRAAAGERGGTQRGPSGMSAMRQVCARSVPLVPLSLPFCPLPRPPCARLRVHHVARRCCTCPPAGRQRAAIVVGTHVMAPCVVP